LLCFFYAVLYVKLCTTGKIDAYQNYPQKAVCMLQWTCSFTGIYRATGMYGAGRDTSASEEFCMPFSAHDLRYHLEEHYASLNAYLQQRAQRYLGSLAFDAVEVDHVVGHVIEQLTHLHIMGGGDSAPETALDRLTNAQFYAFLNRCVKNKAIDRLRKHRAPTSTLAELERPGATDDDAQPMEGVVETLWGTVPFGTPEEMALEAASQQTLRQLLKHCIEALSAAPRQLEAVLQELEELDARDMAREIRQQCGMSGSAAPLAHASQHRDHAHKKLRHCLQQSSTNLAVVVALRLSEYETVSTAADVVLVDIRTLAHDNLSIKDVQTGLKHLTTEGLLNWHGEEALRLLPSQCKRLARFYEEGE
jgi:DNA-directed RNA polymerase specialized sigma24 family protein